jgi:hypothetical protein
MMMTGNAVYMLVIEKNYLQEILTRCIINGILRHHNILCVNNSAVIYTENKDKESKIYMYVY